MSIKIEDLEKTVQALPKASEATSFVAKKTESGISKNNLVQTLSDMEERKECVNGALVDAGLKGVLITKDGPALEGMGPSGYFGSDEALNRDSFEGELILEESKHKLAKDFELVEKLTLFAKSVDEFNPKLLVLKKLYEEDFKDSGWGSGNFSNHLFDEMARILVEAYLKTTSDGTTQL